MDQNLLKLKSVIAQRNNEQLSKILAIIYDSKLNENYTKILLNLLDQKWHTTEEDIVEILALIKDNNSTNKLFEIAVDVPDYDDMRALAKKCIWALYSIATEDAINKLKILADSEDPIISKEADYFLKQ